MAMATKVSFIPNDPQAAAAPGRKIAPIQFPPAAARFDVRPSAPAGLYAVRTPQFDFWQTQTALVLGTRAWKELDGGYLPRWFGNKAVLPARTNAGDDLNAFYDRRSLQFFSHTFEGRTVHSCESVDVVTHEQGHAFLDAIRPDFFDVPYIEAGALHESFGDCSALLVALLDARIRTAALAASPDLGSNQFLESLAEEMGDAIGREFGKDQVEKGALRHALNKFKWVDPTTLPSSAPASKLSSEVHSFSRVFTGCFYDTIRNIFAKGAHTSARLRAAAVMAGRLLHSALRTVPATPALFAGVGRRMLQADAVNNGSANVSQIRAAFQAHGIVLPAPVTSLPVPLTAGRAAAATASRELRAWLGAPKGAALRFTEIRSDLHGSIAHVAAYRPIALHGKGLERVDILVPAVARVQTRGRAVVGLLGDASPIASAEEAHARAFVKSLVANGDLQHDRPGRRVRRPPRPTSHAIEKVGGKRTIVRQGFA